MIIKKIKIESKTFNPKITPSPWGEGTNDTDFIRTEEIGDIGVRVTYTTIKGVTYRRTNGRPCRIPVYDKRYHALS